MWGCSLSDLRRTSLHAMDSTLLEERLSVDQHRALKEKCYIMSRDRMDRREKQSQEVACKISAERQLLQNTVVSTHEMFLKPTYSGEIHHCSTPFTVRSIFEIFLTYLLCISLYLTFCYKSSSFLSSNYSKLSA